MFSGWLYSFNWKNQENSHVLMLPANFIPGREAEYHKWYDEVHRFEVTETPGFVAMRRGRLLPEDLQIEPRNYCPGSQLILNAMQTDDVDATIDEFIARSTGASKVLNHAPRSGSASIGRTVHCFKRLTTIRP